MATYATKHRIGMLGGPIDGQSVPRLGTEKVGDLYLHHTQTEGGEVIARYVFNGEAYRFDASRGTAAAQGRRRCDMVGDI